MTNEVEIENCIIRMNQQLNMLEQFVSGLRRNLAELRTLIPNCDDCEERMSEEPMRDESRE